MFRKVSRDKEDIKKETGLTSRDENCNVWKEKHTGWDQQQIRGCERKDEWTWRQQWKRKGNTMRRENRTEQSISKLWDSCKRPNICAMRPLKGEEKGVGCDKIFEEILAEKFTISDENCNHTHTWKPKLRDPKHKPRKENEIKFLKTCDKEKNL